MEECLLNFFYYEVEHEFHFILPLYNNPRSKFFADINKRHSNFNDLIDQLKKSLLMALITLTLLYVDLQLHVYLNAWI